MNKQICEKCKGSGFLGIDYDLLETENGELETINLLKCHNFLCRNGYLDLPIDDSNYDSDNISKND